MQPDSLLENLTSKVAGILYYSESEYPLMIEQWEPHSEADVATRIAALLQVDPNIVKPVSPTDFFNEVTRTPDPNDAPIVENALKFKDLQQFLNEHFTSIQVFRVENGTRIPVYIVCHQPDGTCVALNTTAIET
ncbi:nuclease A inhibitor family protein [Chitinophaga sp. Hz27]|uniref:nuclease A inhibitor family protein n=1 Tax=Chitinophaga sp. Hz27 TaxID=3347169 RepID=UPI0035E2122C